MQHWWKDAGRGQLKWGGDPLSLPIRPALSVNVIFITEVYEFDVQLTVHRDKLTFS